MIKVAHYDSPVGELLLAENNGGLAGLWIKGQKYYFGKLKGETKECKTEEFEKIFDWLDRYFAGNKPSPKELNISPDGTDFQKAVWDIISEIPYGETTTYGDIAKELARRRGLDSMSAQAVGSATGHNPISIIIPCHRVVASNGDLTGYAGGLEIKERLLKHEGVMIRK